MKTEKLIELPPAIPITLGIVGNRDAIITFRHHELINGLFDDLFDKYPDSPLYLLSQLAEGADSYVADLFLERKRPHDALIVPVPFNTDAYEKTFDDKGHISRFRELAGKADRHFVLDCTELTESNKDVLFRAGGKFIADSSIILIVMWDGSEKNRKTGGTADIVYYKINGTFSDDDFRNIYEKPSTFVSIKCNRKSGEQSDVTFNGPLLDALLKSDKVIDHTLKKIQELNKAATFTSQANIQESLEYLLPERDILGKEQHMLASYYCLADDQARKNQKWYLGMLTGLFVASMSILTVFEFYKHLLTIRNILFGAFILIMVAITAWRYTHKKKHHLLFLTARVLAESLRVQFFWSLAGLRDNAADNILRLYRKEYDWIKYILNGIYGISYSSELCWEPGLIIKYWLKGQQGYFTMNKEKIKRKIKRWTRISVGSLFFGILSIVIMLSYHSYLQNIKLKIGENKNALDCLIVVTGLLLGLFALLKAYIEKRGYKQLLNQEELMEDVFSKTIDRLNNVGPNKKIAMQQLFKQAGVEALIENGNWYLIYKDKEPDLDMP